MYNARVDKTLKIFSTTIFRPPPSPPPHFICYPPILVHGSRLPWGSFYNGPPHFKKLRKESRPPTPFLIPPPFLQLGTKEYYSKKHQQSVKMKDRMKNQQSRQHSQHRQPQQGYKLSPQGYRPPPQGYPPSQFDNQYQKENCPRCGNSRHKGSMERECSAWGKECNKCVKLNHFSKVC